MTPSKIIPGFLFNGLAGGIKKNGGKDLALIYSEVPAQAAGIMTRNWVKAAPVLLTQERLQKGTCRCVLVNSGNANACTGPEGMEDARILGDQTAGLLDLPPDEVLVASTGVIGERLPRERMASHLPALCRGLSLEKMDDFAEAIMTTDTVPKVAVRTGNIGGKEITIAGLAKGAGMINPSVATMLVFLLTDAAVEPGSLRAALKSGAGESFNRITIDGDTSTNDTVLFLANGRAGNRVLTRRSSQFSRFQAEVTAVMKSLAQQILRDGEGVTKVAEVRVEGARSVLEAETIARSIANSPLVKTSFYGEELNWGRILAAAGKTRFSIAFEKIDLFLNGLPLVRQGIIQGAEQERRVQTELTHPEFCFTLALHQGNHSFSVLTTDFSPAYVTINAGYKS